MLPKAVVATLAALSTCTFAVNPSLEKRAFTLRSIPKRRVIDGPSALRKAYLKHGIDVPVELRKRQLIPASPLNTSGSTASDIALSEKNDLEYLSPVQIGGTTLQLDFDTGSSDL